MDTGGIGEQLNQSVDRLAKAMRQSEDFRKSGVVYTTVIRNALHELNLDPRDYLMADTIHKLSGNASKIHGWCYASKQYLAKSINVSERTAFRSINRLKDKGLIEHHQKQAQLLRTTQNWIEAVEVRKRRSTRR